MVALEPVLLNHACEAGYTEDYKATCHLSTGPEEEGSNVVHCVGLLMEDDGGR